MFDVELIRKEFPQLLQKPYGKDLVYLDSGATSLTPKKVIDAIVDYYTNNSASVHRGAHYLSEKATDAFEKVRVKVRNFIGASDSDSVVFTKGTTEGANLIAQSFVKHNLKPGDEILVTEMEHHANFVPWQQIAKEIGAVLKWIPIDEKGDLVADWESYFTEKTKLFCVTHTSNVIGAVNPVKALSKKAHAVGAHVVVDAAQAVPHEAVDVADLDCDFLIFSAHKMFGPTGVGVLYVREPLLDSMTPYQFGGAMVDSVSLKATTFLPGPERLEAGTPNVAGVIGLGAAVDFLRALPRNEVQAYETHLTESLLSKLSSVPSLNVVGQPKNRAPIVSFLIDGIHPHDISSIVDRDGIAIRAGHMCAQPLVHHYGVSAFSRASLSLFNTEAELDQLVNSLKKVVRLFHG